MAFPVPLLFLIAGALGVKALAGRGEKPRCTPKSLFGKSRVPLSQGGYPMLAAAYVEDWLESTKAGASSVFALNAASKMFAVQIKWEEAVLNWELAGSAEPTIPGDLLGANVQVDAAGKEWAIAKQSAVGASWTIADQILKSLGCPAVTDNREGLRDILVNEESWLRWLLAMGAYINLSFVETEEVEETHKPSMLEALEASFQFLDSHFRRGLSADNGQGQIEAAQYTSTLRPLLQPLPGAVATLRVKLEGMSWETPGWLFGPLSQGAQPWTPFEAKMQGLASLLAHFLTGQNSDPNLEEWSFPDNVLGGWLAIDLTGKKPTTDGGYTLMSALGANALGAVEPKAYPDWYYLGSHPALGDLPGLPFSSVRGRPDEAWWDWNDAYIQDSLGEGMKSVDIAVNLLSVQGGAGTLVKLYPFYQEFLDQNPDAYSSDYVDVHDAFTSEYPIVWAAISNVQALLSARYQ